MIHTSDIPDLGYDIDPPAAADHRLSDSRAYRQMIEYFGVFTHYFTNLPFGGECQVTCRISQGGNAITKTNPEHEVWPSTDSGFSIDSLMDGSSHMIEINRDPMHESNNPTSNSLADLIFECNVKNQYHMALQNEWVQSN